MLQGRLATRKSLVRSINVTPLSDLTTTQSSHPLIDYHFPPNHGRSFPETSLSDIAPIIDGGTFNDYSYSSYPCHLFDTERGRNTTRAELKGDISAALGRWLALPLTCSDILESISNTLSPRTPSQYKHKPPKQALWYASFHERRSLNH